MIIWNSDCLLDSKLEYASFSVFVGKNVEAGFPEGEGCSLGSVSPAVCLCIQTHTRFEQIAH